MLIGYGGATEVLKLDVNVLWLSKCTYLPGHDVLAHSHPFYHYIYVIGGSACLTVDHERYIVQEDEFYMVPRNIGHSIIIGGTKGLRTIEIKFTVSDMLSESLIDMKEQIRFTNTKIRYMTENLISEGMSKAAYRKDIINLLFLEIIMHLLRMNIENDATAIPDTHVISTELLQDIKCQNIPDLANILTYLDKNLGQKINLDVLAKESSMGKHYFIRMFKSFYGVTPIHYLNNLRIARAKELMSYSEKSITQIVDSVGFSDVHYFSRFFRKRENMSPNEYRKMVRGSHYIYLDKNIL